MSEAWSDEENTIIVATYGAMLLDEHFGRSYVKAEYNRLVQSKIDRSRGSIEFKFQNVSAVLMGLGEIWIHGYKPAFNYQSSLLDAVLDWLAQNSDWSQRLPLSQHSGFSEDEPLWIGPPPTNSNLPEPDALPKLIDLAKLGDAAGRDERNHRLGKAGEARVLAHEKSSLRNAGAHDLSEKVRWVAQVDGDGAGYDILSFEPSGQERLLEVKTTNGWERTPFHISRNELAVAERNIHTWCLVRLWDFSRKPQAFEIRPPLDRHVSLTPTSFEASFK